MGNAATIDAFVKDESKDGLAAPRRCLSNGLVWNAVAIVLGLGALTTVVALLADPHLYAAIGGRWASLAAALAYSDVVFAGAVLLWLFNALAAVVRGTGNMLVPAGVMCAGTAALIPLSPALIFGVGPLPRLGVVGGAVAVLAYYVAGIVVFAADPRWSPARLQRLGRCHRTSGLNRPPHGAPQCEPLCSHHSNWGCFRRRHGVVFGPSLPYAPLP